MSNPEQVSTHTVGYFDSMNQIAGQITDQNNRYDNLASDPQFEDFEDIRQAGVDGLWLEQAYTIDELKDQDFSPYDTLINEHLVAVRELQEVQERYATITDQEDARISRIRQVARRAVELSPLSEQHVSELAEQKITNAQDMNREEASMRMSELSGRIAGLDEVIAVAGQAWEIPRIPSGAVEEATDIVEHTPEYIDILPVDPGERNHEGTSYTRNVEEFLSGAASRITELLISTKGEIVTDKAIADRVYANERDFNGKTDDEIDVRNHRAAGRLMRPDAKVTELLDQQGLAIQYGWRVMVHPGTETRVKGTRKLRIYRIAEQEVIENADDLIEHIDYYGSTSEPVDQSNVEITTEPIDEVLVSRALLDWLRESKILPENGKKVQSAYLRAQVLNPRFKKTTPIELASYRRTLHARVGTTGAGDAYSAQEIVANIVDAYGNPAMEAEVRRALDEYYALDEASNS